MTCKKLQCKEPIDYEVNKQFCTGHWEGEIAKGEEIEK
jgi:hypothetical protein